jgi:rubrerythrin
MLGAIKKHDIVAHPLLTIRCFGFRVLWKTLTAPSNSTFLTVLTANLAVKPAHHDANGVFSRCIELERMTQQIYVRLAERFPEAPEARRFFELLARQEEQHAELLGVCHHEAGRCGWDQECNESLERVIPQTKLQIELAIGRAECVETVREALGLVLEVVEMSEIHLAFLSLIAATDSDFVRFLPAFQRATRSHLDFVARQIRDMAPFYTERCNELLRCIQARDLGTSLAACSMRAPALASESDRQEVGVGL